MNSIDLNHLRHSEYISFNRNYIQIINLNNAKTLLVNDEVDFLNVETTKIEALFLQSQKSGLTPELEALDNRRDKAVIGFIKVVDSFTYHYILAKNEAATLISNALIPFGAGIAKLNYVAETAQIDRLVKEILNNTNLSDAANLLGIVDWLTELDTANKAFDAQYIARTQELGAANPDNINGLRLNSNEKYYELRDMLDGYFITKKKIDPWKKTINELNALIDQYNQLLVNRKGSSSASVPPAITPIV